MAGNVVFYKVKIPQSQGSQSFRWLDNHAECDKDSIYTTIRKLHPDLVECRIESIGNPKFIKNAGLGSFRVNYGEEEPAAFDAGLPDDTPVRDQPVGAGVEAEFYSYASPPEAGWQFLHFLFSSVKTDPEEFLVDITIHCSNIFDPIDDLIKFMKNVSLNKLAAISIDEEGRFKVIETWPIGDNKLQICLSQLNYIENIQYNFILDSDSFIRSLRDTYQRSFIIYPRDWFLYYDD